MAVFAPIFTRSPITTFSPMWTPSAISALSATQAELKRTNDEITRQTSAWGNASDPDMSQLWKTGTASNNVRIEDAELDELIDEAKASYDQSYRKAMYKACLDIVVDWAVETPTYQRQNAVLFSTERVNMETMTPDITTFYPWASEIENIELN